jgi:hypothetical protein
MQTTVETATHGSEFAACMCVEQIIKIQTFLQYLGVPLCDQSYMFGDNQAVVNSLTLPEAKLQKQHTLLLNHRVCEAIAAKMTVFIHIDGHINPADILSKHWGSHQVWGSLQLLLFWSGDTIDMAIEKHGVVFEEEEKSFVKEGKFKTVVDSNRQGVSDFPKTRDS